MLQATAKTAETKFGRPKAGDRPIRLPLLGRASIVEGGAKRDAEGCGSITPPRRRATRDGRSVFGDGRVVS